MPCRLSAALGASALAVALVLGFGQAAPAGPQPPAPPVKYYDPLP